jgi:glucokinase
MVGTSCAIGVDIGGTYTKIGIIEASGLVRYQEVLHTASRRDTEPYLLALWLALRRLSSEHQPLGIGLSLPGYLSEDRQVITYNPNTPALVGIDFHEALCDLDLPLAFEQDLNTPAVAEYTFGERRGNPRLMTAAIGTGLGAAVMLKGELLRFVGATAGDNGHLILQPEGPACTAGCKGCAEALVSTPAIERAYQELASDPRAATLQEEIRGGTPVAQAVIRAAATGHPLACEIISTLGGWLGQWLAGLAATFMPEVIVLCGGVSEAGDVLREAAERRMRQLAGAEYTARCEVITGKFRGQAGMIGAAIPILMGTHP